MILSKSSPRRLGRRVSSIFGSHVRAWTVILSAFCVGPSQASLLVVDDDGGAGVFPRLSEAIAAAQDGDVILVREGVYREGSFSISKALTLISEAGETVIVEGSIQTTSGADVVLLRGLTFRRAEFFLQPVIVTGAGLHLWIEDCSGSRLVGNQAGSTVAVRSTFSSSEEGLAGVDVSFGNLAFLQCLLSGGFGKPGFVDEKVGSSPGENGPFGVRVNLGTQVFFGGSRVLGGRGGDGATAPVCTAGGDGGAAVGVVAIDADVRFRETTLIGGAPGLGGPVPPGDIPCPNGQTGLPLFSVTSVTVFPTPLPTLTSNGPVREGEALLLEVEGTAGDRVSIYASRYRDHRMRDHRMVERFEGPVLIAPPVHRLATGTLPGEGASTFSVTIPELGDEVDAVPVYLTLFAVTASGDRVFGTSTATVLLDRDF